jgi:hypothetical protein
LPLDPGTHALEVEAHDGAPLERSFLIAEREQGRLLVVDLPARAVEPEVRELRELRELPTRRIVPEAPIVPRPKPAADSFSVPTLAWVLGGVGVAGIATFSVLRIQLGNQLSELERTCSPNCTDQQRDDGKHKAMIADITLGVGIAALAGGVAWTVGSWLAHSGDARDEPRVAFSLVPAPGGAFASVAARY